jgi:DNA-3-methyladenine glycosylase II
MNTSRSIDERGDFDRAYDALAHREPVLAGVIEVYGRPLPFEWHDGGRTGSSNFAALLLHITGQRISAVAAFTIFDRIAKAAGGGIPTAERISALGSDQLRACGLSTAKAGYALNLAEAQTSGTVDIEHLGEVDDATVIAALTSIRGMGLWSAQTFLVHNLRRPDVLPIGDLGVRRGMRALWQLASLPSLSETRQRGMAWAPWRSYAAALLWRSLRPPGEPADPKERALAIVARHHGSGPLRPTGSTTRWT